MIGKWFWEPDEKYVNGINTTNLRSIRGIQLAAFLVALGALAFIWTLMHAVPWQLDPCPQMPCLEPLGRARATDLARAILDSLLIFVELLVGIAVGGAVGKRLTDTDHKVEVELAKQGVDARPPANGDGAPPVPASAGRRRPSRAASTIPGASAEREAHDADV
jgi:hypothetical protein